MVRFDAVRNTRLDEIALGKAGEVKPILYTPKHLAERILAEQSAMEARGALEGERKTVTALFADIKNSMNLIEDLDPEEARSLIDPALQLMMEAVHHYEGAHRALPPSRVSLGEGPTWAWLLLPNLEQQGLYNQWAQGWPYPGIPRGIGRADVDALGEAVGVGSREVHAEHLARQMALRVAVCERENQDRQRVDDARSQVHRAGHLARSTARRGGASDTDRT